MTCSPQRGKNYVLAFFEKFMGSIYSGFLHEALKCLNCGRPWHFYSVFTFRYLKSKGAFQVEQDMKSPSLAR